jgi:septum formation protein
MNRLSLLLASRSPRRRELVALLGLPFDVTTADVPEDPLADESPAQVVTRLSQAKACASSNATIAAATTVAVTIVACDTVVALDGEILGKPRDGVEASEMLRRLRGRAHAVYSAVTLLEPATGRTTTEVAKTQLVMRTYTDAEMAAYVASGDPLDKAGAYAIQHPGFHPVASLRGCYANVVGLPLCHLTRGLRSLGVEPPHDVPTACQAHTGRRCLVYGAVLGCDRTVNGVSGE